MSTFAVLRRNGCVAWEAEHLDLNVWVLPAFLRRQSYLVDIGLCGSLREAAGDRPFEVEVVLPFVPDEDKVTDLIPLMRADNGICSLVFGRDNIDKAANSSMLQDDKGWLRLTSLDQTKCSLLEVDRSRGETRWAISTGAEPIDAGTRVYLRFRYVTHEPGRIWAWQRSGRWNSHAIADIRLNEFRERRALENTLDIEKVVTFPRVNGFMIASANYKAGRQSPQPKYVRILENRVWEPYTKRRLGRRNELFVITYWKDVGVNPNGVSPSHPFRAFLEVERRRPTALKSVMIGVLLITLATVLLQQPSSLRSSIAAVGFDWLWQIVIGSVSLTVFYGVTRFLARQLSKGNLDRLRQGLRAIEGFWYRVT